MATKILLDPGQLSWLEDQLYSVRAVAAASEAAIKRFPDDPPPKRTLFDNRLSVVQQIKGAEKISSYVSLGMRGYALHTLLAKPNFFVFRPSSTTGILPYPDGKSFYSAAFPGKVFKIAADPNPPINPVMPISSITFSYNPLEQQWLMDIEQNLRPASPLKRRRRSSEEVRKAKEARLRLGGFQHG